MPEIAAIVLAAGQGKRYRAEDPKAVSKVLALLDGKPLLRHVVDAAAAVELRPIIVVTGHARQEVERALEGGEAIFVHNADFAQGMATSLKAGVHALPQTVAAALILLADMPRVSATTIERLIATFYAHPNVDAIIPVHRGRRGNPVLLARRLFARIVDLHGDEGARSLFSKPDVKVIEAEVADDVTCDVDTPEILQRLQERG